MDMLSIVVPMYFEEDVVEECYSRLTEVCQTIENINYELVFVNDGSTDETLSILKKLHEKDKHVKIVNFSRNFGHSAAVSAGIDYAKGDAVVLIDADLQDPPELIKIFVEKWREGYDVVYGVRSKRKGETVFKKATAHLYYAFLDNLSEIDIPRNTGDYRLMDKRVCDIIRKMPEKNRFIRGMVSWVGFKQIGVEYIRDERYAGETKYSIKKMFSFAADGVMSFSNKPLKAVLYLGFITLIIDVVFIIYVLYSFFSGKAVSGWSSVMLIIAFFFGVLFITLGIIGQYIARISDDVKSRPLYVVSEFYNED